MLLTASRSSRFSTSTDEQRENSRWARIVKCVPISFGPFVSGGCCCCTVGYSRLIRLSCGQPSLAGPRLPVNHRAFKSLERKLDGRVLDIGLRCEENIFFRLVVFCE